MRVCSVGRGVALHVTWRVAVENGEKGFVRDNLVARGNLLRIVDSIVGGRG